MKAFRISGRFRMGRRWQPFSKELAASDEVAAREKLLSVLGSQHGVPRKYVTIAQVAEVPADQIEAHAVRYAVEPRARAQGRPNSVRLTRTPINTGRRFKRCPNTCGSSAPPSPAPS